MPQILYNTAMQNMIKKLNTGKAIAILFVAFVVLVSGIANVAKADSYGDSWTDTGGYTWDQPSYDTGTSYSDSWNNSYTTSDTSYYTNSYDYYQPTTDYSYQYSTPSYTYQYSTPSYQYSTPSYNYGGYTYQYYPRQVAYNPPPVQTQSLSGSCVISPSSVNVGDNVMFSASASGGNGNYSYSWSGSEGLSSSQATFNGYFNNPGVKTANVTIYSAGQSITRTCSVNVNQNQNYNQNLDGSCYSSPSNANTGDNVYWYGSATGGNGNYTYSWSGTDNLVGYGQTANRTYSYTGTKYAYLTITSNGQSITRTCSTNIGGNYVNGTINAYCSANPSNASVGQNVNWTVNASGGTGYYTYSWSGSDGLYGTSQVQSYTYNNPGYKYATVNVYSNGQSTTVTCNTNVGNYNNQSNVTVVRNATPASGVFLSQVPATGISFNGKLALFILGLTMWSAFMAYIVIEKKKGKLAMNQKSKLENFKLENMKKKGIL